MKIRKVKWRDSRMHIEQEPRDTKWKPCVIESVGFVLEDTKSHIVLAGDLLEDEKSVRRVIVIPKENII